MQKYNKSSKKILLKKPKILQDIYNSITNLMFQHKPKKNISSFKNPPHNNRPITWGTKIPEAIATILYNESKHNNILLAFGSSRQGQQILCKPGAVFRCG
jgi:hypothetical protein